MTQLRCPKEGVEMSCDPRAPLRPWAVVVLAADDDTAQHSLGGVVVKRNVGIAEESGQCRPRG